MTLIRGHAHEDAPLEVRADVTLVRAALAVYEGVIGQVSVDVLISPDSRMRSHRYGTTAAELDEAARAVVMLDDAEQPSGIYLRGTTVDPGAPGRGKAEHSVMWTAVRADLDLGKPGGPSTWAELCAAFELTDLPAPSWWQHSGGGFYPTWVLAEPVADGAEIRAVAEDVEHELRRAWVAAGYTHGVDACHDAARVWRLSGTVHRKDRHNPVLSTVGNVSGELRTVDELRGAVPRRTPATQRSITTTGGLQRGHRLPFTRAQAQAHVRGPGERFNLSSEGGQNNALNALCMALGHFATTEHRPGHWSRAEAERWAEEAAVRNGYAQRDPGGMRRTIASGLEAGMRDPYPCDVAPADSASAEQGETAAAPARRLRMVRASAVVPKAARWLWQTGEYGRIPLGEVSVLAGRGNVGKSPFALWCAARLTRGELPGELFGAPVDVLIYASEDSHEHTTVPRLTAAGADLDRVHLLNGTETDEDPEMPLVWSRDIDLIREAIEQTSARLLVIDPLIDVHRGGANTDRTDDVRAGLRPLVALAHRTGTAITGIAHFNKQRTGDVATLLSGSHGLRDTVRAVLAFVERPDGERVLGQDKNNLGRAGDDVPRLTYDMASIDVPIDGAPVSQPVFTITGTTDDTLSDVLLGGATDRADLPDDTAWLFELVAAGHPLPLHAKKCADEAERRGLKWDTVSRKARRSGLLVSRQERGAVAHWVWTLTDDGARRAGKAPAPTEVDGA